ncbi:MAG: sulfatase-like hydrolase/transferase [Burkholderiaceae bacterium]
MLALIFSGLFSWPLWRAVLALPETGAARLLSLGALMLGVNLVLFALLPLGRWPRTVTTLALLVGAATLHFMLRYGVVLNPQMMHNALQTDAPEAAELITRRLLTDVALFGLLPALIMAALPFGPLPPLSRAIRQRLALGLTGLAVTLGAIASNMHDLAPLMRNHKELRYLFSPGNLLASSLSALRGSQLVRSGPREPIDPSVQGRQRDGEQPRRVVVMVLGETVRAANWGLAGYERQTTPLLAARDDLVTLVADSCGTDTATSVPCMFSDIGRDQYDRERIANRENLLHLAQRAGVAVQWREAQAGCKGVCDGIDTVWLRLDPDAADGVDCRQRECHDLALLEGLPEVIDRAQGDLLIVLHQMGNHGPGYWRRVPESAVHYKPICAVDDLSRCTDAEILNAYDNAIRYTDSMLAALVGLLEQRADRVDTAMLYVSDHGESLGEQGLYLHGLPRWMAPDVQTKVPMVLWLSEPWRSRSGLDAACRRKLTEAGGDHDQVFHTLVGLLGLRTKAYQRGQDLLAVCRPPAG